MAGDAEQARVGELVEWFSRECKAGRPVRIDEALEGVAPDQRAEVRKVLVMTALIWRTIPRSGPSGPRSEGTDATPLVVEGRDGN